MLLEYRPDIPLNCDAISRHFHRAFEALRGETELRGFTSRSGSVMWQFERLPLRQVSHFDFSEIMWCPGLFTRDLAAMPLPFERIRRVMGNHASEPPGLPAPRGGPSSPTLPAAATGIGKRHAIVSSIATSAAANFPVWT